MSLTIEFSLSDTDWIPKGSTFTPLDHSPLVVGVIEDVQGYISDGLISFAFGDDPGIDPHQKASKRQDPDAAYQLLASVGSPTSNLLSTIHRYLTQPGDTHSRLGHFGDATEIIELLLKESGLPPVNFWDY